MSTKNPKNMIDAAPITQDRRSIAGRRRLQAQRQMNDVTVELIKQVIDEGVPADYVLFDSWFTSPKMFWQLKQLCIDSVGMVKQSKKVYYRYRKRLYDVKGLYDRLAALKMHQKKNYFYSCVVKAEYQGYTFRLRLVFASNRGKGKQYLVLASTNTSLSPEEIIQLYGRRWQIEIYFKTAKQYLALQNDGQYGYIAITALTYNLLALQEQLNTYDRTIGDIFYLINDAFT